LRCVCPECGGKGEYEVDVARPMGFGRDVGYLDSEWVDCDRCGGSGEIEVEEEVVDE